MCAVAMIAMGDCVFQLVVVWTVHVKAVFGHLCFLQRLRGMGAGWLQLRSRVKKL